MNPEVTAQSLAQLAVTLPAASRVFQRHGLDFCCRGNRSLADACREQSVDPEIVAEQILQSGQARLDWSKLSVDELVAHVIQRYHAPARVELPDLLSMARRVESRHAGKPACPVGLAALLEGWTDELLAHMHKEEAALFPMFRAGATTAASMPVRVMEAEHRAHGEALGRVRELTTDLVAPEHACTTWRALYLRLEEFERDLMEHIAFEERILFPRGLGQPTA